MTKDHHQAAHTHGHPGPTHGAPDQSHGHDTAVAHEPPASWREAYERAYHAAVPDPGRAVVPVRLEAMEFDWEFKPGRTTRAWGFNSRVPGPTIEAQVGDVLEVALTNHLPEATAIHWHGLRVPAAMDGTEMVQRPVPPGESLTYRFRLPDAGTFWYHPHLNETIQLERGLYGAIKPPGWWLESHNGREGSTRLVNGMQEPELTMAAGQIERWRIINAASARYIRLSLGGRPFSLLGTDGGLIASPVTMSEVLLAPADRVEIAVGPFTEGETLSVMSLGYQRGKIGGKPRAELFGRLRVGPAARSSAAVPNLLRHVEPLVTGPITPTREVHLGWKLSRKHGVAFTINRESHHQGEPCEVGELQVWDIVNDSPVDHPFHLHGFFFQVLEVNGRPPEFLSWEDTVNVPGRGRVRIAWLPDDREGEWMYHCHILEHHAAGMMAHFSVVRTASQHGR
jgi:FtsP/CotA-like multicopper oxidase with cupredoxin domain